MFCAGWILFRPLGITSFTFVEQVNTPNQLQIHLSATAKASIVAPICKISSHLTIINKWGGVNKGLFISFAIRLRNCLNFILVCFCKLVDTIEVAPLA